MPGDPSPEQRCRTEIEALHVFFETWLNGTRPNTDAAFERLQHALAPDFALVHPEGHVMTRANIAKGLREGHGGQPGLTIDIRNVRVLDVGATRITAMYEEWQESAETRDGRVSTVVFRDDPDAPNGLRWQHVHETWIERGS